MNPDSSNTRLDLDAIEERASAATEGPWFSQEHPNGGGHIEVKGAPWGGTGSISVAHQTVVGAQVGSDGYGSGGARRSDAEFIAAARSDVPALVSEVRRLRADSVERPGVEWFDDPEFQEWLNELAENMGDEWDRDEAMIAIVVDYVRYLESLRPAVERLVAALKASDELAGNLADALHVLLDAQFRWDRSLDLARGNARRALAEFGQQPTGDEQ